MTALLSVQGVQVQGMDPILDSVLDREQRHWARQLQKRQLSPVLEEGFERAMAVISAIGGVRDKREAIGIIGDIGFFQDQQRAVIESVAEVLHDCYPGPPWIEPVQPDLLMEYLVAKATLEDPGDFDRIVLSREGAHGRFRR
jgi:hypothetical protein